MSKKTKLDKAWVEYLCIPVLNGANAHNLLDFNRFRYKIIPRTNLIKDGKAELLQRDHIAQKLFIAIMNREDIAPSTKTNIFMAARTHFIFCDTHNPSLSPLSESAFIKELEYNSIRQRRGEIKDSTESKNRADLVVLYKWMDVPVKHLITNKIRSGTTQTEHTRGYSDGDLKKLLPLLRSIFKQLYHQFIDDPELHMAVGIRIPTMIFSWKGKDYKVCGGISKIFYTATFLLSYYTWSNSTILYNLKRPSIGSHTPSKNWHQMPAFKRRSFKTITVEIGENNRLEIPKYAMQFFDQLLTVSTLLDPRSDGLLLPAYSHKSKKIQKMSGCLLNDFKSTWLDKHFPMTDDQGNKLWPAPRRFRATGSHLTLARKGAVDAALLLDNTPNTIALSYSSGNPHDNNKMNRDTSHALEQVVRDRQGIESAKKKVREAQKVEVLAYEAYIKRATPPRRSANGSYCKDSNGKMARQFTSRVQNNGLITNKEILACADLLKCWSCTHQVLVESVIDLWCILSFREYIEESIYLHLDKTHYKKNFGQTIIEIDSRLKQLNQNLLHKARRKLADEGRHPLWLDTASIN